MATHENDQTYVKRHSQLYPFWIRKQSSESHKCKTSQVIFTDVKTNTLLPHLQTKSSYAVTFFSLFLLRNGDSKEKGREDFFGALTALGVSSCEMRFFSVETSMEGAE